MYVPCLVLIYPTFFHREAIYSPAQYLPKSIKATESTNNGTDLLDFKLTDIAKREKQSFNAPYRDEPRLKLAFAKYISPCK